MAIQKTGGIRIHSLKLNYTSEMEKALLAAHGVCYKAYSRDHEVRMKVEKQREQEYKQCQRLAADIERKLHY